jgi:hypothetical protein
MLLLTAGTTRASIYGFAHLAQFLVFLEIIVSNPVREAGVGPPPKKYEGGCASKDLFPYPIAFRVQTAKGRFSYGVQQYKHYDRISRLGQSVANPLSSSPKFSPP